MRHLLRDYVLILANTGIRHGTEADNLRWKHITLFEEKGDVFLEELKTKEECVSAGSVFYRVQK